MFIDAKPGATRTKHVTVFSSRPGPQLKLRELLAELPGTDVAPRRGRIFDLNTNLHCSIIGTCLTMAEMRHVLVKLDVEGARSATDHEVHAQGVLLAAHIDGGGKLLNKTLDKKHRGHIARFAKAETAAGVLEIWRQCVREGDIPGAYWAALTHSAATDEIIRKIFGEVHMLSHLVGAANRADIRRLTELEAENRDLKEKVARQQTTLRDAVVTRDRIIERLQQSVSAGTGTTCPSQAGARGDGNEAAVADVVTELGARLGALTRRCERLQERLERARTERDEAIRSREDAAGRERSLIAEIDALDWRFSMLDAGEPETGEHSPTLDMSVLYVGGFTHQIPQLRAAAEKVGVTFLHHDGGMEERSGLINALISRADLIVFPVDCISHVAVTTIKKSCRQTGKRFHALRNSSRASLLAALRAQTAPAGEAGSAHSAVEVSP